MPASAAEFTRDIPLDLGPRVYETELVLDHVTVLFIPVVFGQSRGVLTRLATTTTVVP